MVVMNSAPMIHRQNLADKADILQSNLLNMVVKR